MPSLFRISRSSMEQRPGTCKGAPVIGLRMAYDFVISQNCVSLQQEALLFEGLT